MGSLHRLLLPPQGHAPALHAVPASSPRRPRAAHPLQAWDPWVPADELAARLAREEAEEEAEAGRSAAEL